MNLDHIAIKALNDLTESGVPIPEYRIADAKDFAREGYDYLSETHTYDAMTYASSLAARAIREYVKIRLMGREPTTIPDFDIAARTWATAAARRRSEHHRRDLDAEKNRLTKTYPNPVQKFQNFTRNNRS